jgi:hypothetical protein
MHMQYNINCYHTYCVFDHMLLFDAAYKKYHVYSYRNSKLHIIDW